MDITAKLEALAAAPRPFVCVTVWRHDDGRVERREFAQPRRAMIENHARRYLGNIGRTYEKEAGGRVTLESCNIVERLEA